MDENGNRVLDDDGIPMFEMKICDVIGKFYKDLPEDLRKRFNNFNVNVTKFFNCTDEQIAEKITENGYQTADHILLMTVDSTTGEELSQNEQTEKRMQAELYLKQLNQYSKK